MSLRYLKIDLHLSLTLSRVIACPEYIKYSDKSPPRILNSASDVNTD
jgi:hypothetical protein